MTTNEFLIRPATQEDLAPVLSLIRELADFERLAGPDEEAARRFTADALREQPPFSLWVAEADGRCVGYAIHFMTYSSFLCRPSLYLEDLYVQPDFRRRGIASAFMQRLAALAAERDCGRFEWTVLDWNLRAQEFYVALGAAVLPDWRICRLVRPGIAALSRG